MTDYGPKTGKKRRITAIGFRRLRQELDGFTAVSDGRNDRLGYVLHFCLRGRLYDVTICSSHHLVSVLASIYNRKMKMFF
jgi:hypothetical protein